MNAAHCLRAGAILVLLLPALRELRGAVHVQHDYAARREAGERQSLRLLRKAMSKASTVESPEGLFCDIARASIAVHDGKDARQVIREMADRLQEWEGRDASWPTSEVNAFAVFARCVAPYSEDERDAYLARAIRRSRHQASRSDKASSVLKLKRELWQQVRASRRDRGQAVTQMKVLLGQARELGYTPSDAVQSCETVFLDELTGLDPELTLLVWPEKRKAALPSYCFAHAQKLHKHTYGRTNAFSRVLLNCAVKHGKPSAELLILYKHYDLADAYARAIKLPWDYSGGERSRSVATADILGYLAWSDPEEALRLAEVEEDENALRDVIQEVSAVWAYTRPEQVERAVRKQPNKHRKSWARRIASEELARRREGKPPTSSPDAFCPSGESPRQSTRQRFACSPAERDQRIAMLREIIETSQDDTLYELTCMFMHDKALALELMRPNKYYSTRQSYLVRVVDEMGYRGDHGLGEELLDDIERPEAYVRSACRLAEHVVKRIYVLPGKGAPRIRKRANVDEAK